MLYRNYKIAKVRELANHLGRAGVSELVIEAVNEFDGSYKGAMELAGKLYFIAEMSTFDEYWQEKTQNGLSKMTDKACVLMKEFKEK